MTQAELDKRNLLLEYARRFAPKVFVETGTYKGDTVKAMFASGLFTAIYTIDIYLDRVERARRRFGTFGTIHCFDGDSAEVLPLILEAIGEPALFWLDAHHSGKQIARAKGLVSTPILAELEAVLAHSHADEHVILIDDARYYVTFPEKYPDYPTLAALETLVRQRLPDAVFDVTNDIIRIHRVDREETG